jgi:acyl-CoA thioesterase FadM
MTSGGFELACSGEVAHEWIDLNGHMNVGWHAALFDRAARSILEQTGLICNGKPSLGVAMVAGRMALRFRGELRLGERWELWSGVAEAGPEVLVLTHRLKSGRRSCSECDMTLAAIDLVTRKRVMIPEIAVHCASGRLIPGLRIDERPLGSVR